MSIETVRCNVLQDTVTRVIDLEGAVTRIICAEYDEPMRECRIKQRSLGGGPLSRLLDRVAEHTLDRSSTRCDLIR